MAAEKFTSIVAHNNSVHGIDIILALHYRNKSILPKTCIRYIPKTALITTGNPNKYLIRTRELQKICNAYRDKELLEDKPVSHITLSTIHPTHIEYYKLEYPL